MKSVLSRSGYPLVLIVGLSISACGGGLPFPGLTVEEVYNLGVGALEEENWGDAARAFEEVLLTWLCGEVLKLDDFLKLPLLENFAGFLSIITVFFH